MLNTIIIYRVSTRSRKILLSVCAETSQQWDYPNVWPPLVEMTVTALERTNDTRVQALARGVATNFLRNVLR